MARLPGTATRAAPWITASSGRRTECGMWTRLCRRQNKRVTFRSAALLSVTLDQLIDHPDQRVQLLGNFEDCPRMIAQNTRLVPLHPGLFALNVYDLHDGFLDMFEPLF